MATSFRMALVATIVSTGTSYMVKCDEHHDCPVPGGPDSVLSAWWGRHGLCTGIDVTAEVRALCGNNTMRVEASVEHFGDPCVGTKKRLYIDNKDEFCSDLGHVECSGDDLKDVGKMATQEECCAFCANTPGCLAWTWDKHIGQKCHLKSACFRTWHNVGKRSGTIGGPSTSTSTTTTSGGAGGSEVADDLNRRYFGLDEKDDASPLGVTATMHNTIEIFCKNAPCFNGHADCRMSASLYNHKMLLTRSGNKIKFGLERIAGIVWKQDMVEQLLNKCSYIFDGASFQRYNGACGCGTGGGCDAKFSAYSNVCPSTGKRCEVVDKEVEACSCDAKGVPADVNSYQCFFKGPALDNRNVSASRDQLRWMAKTRLNKQAWAKDLNEDPLEYWNELVLDEELMLPLLKRDAALLVQAFIYERNNNVARSMSRKMRDDFLKRYPSSTEIPIIAVDTSKNVGRSKQIFFADVFETSVPVHASLPENMTVV